MGENGQKQAKKTRKTHALICAGARGNQSTYGGEEKVSEHDVEARLVKEVRALGGMAMKVTSPGLAGVPDRLVMLPGGRTAWVEVKAPGKKPRPLQAAMHRRLVELGQQVYVLDSIDQIAALLDEI